MVTLASVKESNALISKLPPGLVGVFTGATAGIGEAALKQFVHDAVKPRCYFVGRSEEAAQRIIEECKGLNPDAAVVFIRADLSLMKEVDRVAEKIKSQEKAINVMFLSSGAALFDRNSEFCSVLFSFYLCLILMGDSFFIYARRSIRQILMLTFDGRDK